MTDRAMTSSLMMSRCWRIDKKNGSAIVLSVVLYTKSKHSLGSVPSVKEKHLRVYKYKRDIWFWIKTIVKTDEKFKFKVLDLLIFLLNCIQLFSLRFSDAFFVILRLSSKVGLPMAPEPCSIINCWLLKLLTFC